MCPFTYLSSWKRVKTVHSSFAFFSCSFHCSLLDYSVSSNLCNNNLFPLLFVIFWRLWKIMNYISIIWFHTSIYIKFNDYFLLGCPTLIIALIFVSFFYFFLSLLVTSFFDFSVNCENKLRNHESPVYDEENCNQSNS